MIFKEEPRKKWLKKLGKKGISVCSKHILVKISDTMKDVDALALANRIKNVIKMSKEDREKMGRLARQNMQENYNNQAISSKWEELFENLIKD